MLTTPNFLELFVQRVHIIFSSLQFNFNYDEEEEVVSADKSVAAFVAAHTGLSFTENFGWVCVCAALRYLCLTMHECTTPYAFQLLMGFASDDDDNNDEEEEEMSVAVRDAHTHQLLYTFFSN